MPAGDTPHQATTATGYAIAFGPFWLHPGRHLLLEADEPVPIGTRALEILIALLAQPGELVTKAQLVARAWPNTVVEESNLRAQVAVLRRALRDGRAGTRYITAVPGRGYRFVAATTRLEAKRESAVGAGRRGNLPIRLTQIIGRADVVSVLSTRIRRRRLVTIVGPGGIGKTTVALATAAELSASYDGGVWCLDLAPLADPTLVPSALAATLGLAIAADDPTEELIALLRDKRILIVLDGCERVIESAAILAGKILNGAPHVDILATSREPLRAEGESVHRLSPLGVPPVMAGLTAAQALTYPAVELFVERAISITEEFQLTDGDAPVAADICRQLDGIALAIELAAGRINAFGMRGVAKRLDDRFRLLTGGRRTALPRHQTLSATLDWSYEILPERERALLRRLAVFVGGFTLESVGAVAADSDLLPSDIPDLMAELVAKSLVSAETAGGVVAYRLLDTMRAYAVKKLQESEESASIPQRHAEYFQWLFERALTEWESRPAAEWLSSYGREIDNLRAALDWAFSPNGDTEIGMALTVGAIPLWFQRSSTDECRLGVERALSRAETGASRDAHARQIMQLYLALGLSRTFTIGLAPQAAAAWMKAFEIAESLNDREFELEALWGLWFCHIGTGEYGAALEVAQKFCGLAETAPDLLIGDRLMGVPLHCLGQHTSARHRIERLLDSDPVPVNSSQGVRFRFGQPMAARVILAQMLWLQGFPDQAADAARSSVDEARATGHAISICDAIAQAACPIAMFIGDLAAAEQAVTMLIDQSSVHALGPWSVLGRCWKAALLVKSGELDVGLPLLRSAIEELREVRFAFYHSKFLGLFAEGLASAGDFKQGLSVIDGALARCEQKAEHWYIAELLRIKGAILMQCVDPDLARAEEHFLRSLDWARRRDALSWELRTATSLARLRRIQGRAAEARTDLAAVHDRFSEGFATTDLRTAKALVAELS